jgi:DNA-binding IclR family transcriptional regulator
VHNIAGTLVAQGYLRQEGGTRRYLPGLKLLLLARHDDYLSLLSSRAAPTVRKLATRLGESIMLAALDHHRVLRVDYIPSSHALRVQEPEDLSTVVHCTATGKVLLAAMPPADRERYLSETSLKAFTPRTAVSREALNEQLDAVSRNGFAVVDGELAEGVVAIAVPVKNPWGRTMAAIGASGPSVRLGPSKQDGIVQMLQATAEQIQQDWREVPDASGEGEVRK